MSLKMAELTNKAKERVGVCSTRITDVQKEKKRPREWNEAADPGL